MKVEWIITWADSLEDHVELFIDDELVGGYIFDKNWNGELGEYENNDVDVINGVCTGQCEFLTDDEATELYTMYISHL